MPTQGISLEDIPALSKVVGEWSTVGFATGLRYCNSTSKWHVGMTDRSGDITVFVKLLTPPPRVYEFGGRAGAPPAPGETRSSRPDGPDRFRISTIRHVG